MSYRINIGFKKVKNGDEAFSALYNYKKYIVDHLEELANNPNYIRCCPITYWSKEQLLKLNGPELEERLIKWAAEKCFKNIFFYSKKFKVVGINLAMGTEDFFDKVVLFQDSCEQDYEREIWEGIPAFEGIYDDVMEMPDREFASYIVNSDHFNEEADQNYVRRVYVYEQIWKELEYKVFEDKDTLYLSVFSDLYSYSTLEPFTGILGDKLRRLQRGKLNLYSTEEKYMASSCKDYLERSFNYE